MLSAVVLRPFIVGEIQFTTGEIVTDSSLVSLLQQEYTYGQNVIFSDFSGPIDVTPTVPLTPLQAESARAKAAETVLSLAVAGEASRARAAEAALLPATNAAFLTLLATAFGTLPTSYPSSPGVLWNNGGTLSIS